MVTRISPQEAARKLTEGWVYVDIRPDDEFAEGHPTGAVNVPYTRDASRFVAAVRERLGPSAKLVLGCKSGLVSVHAATMLAPGVLVVPPPRPGFDGARGTFGELKESGWARAGLPVAREDNDA
jgi:rhodanese-related sulfurtransferase